MGFWVRCGNKMMEVTSFKINEYNHIDEDRKSINAKEGIMLFSSDAEQILVNYCSERYAKLVFNKLVSHVARLEILTRCVENFDAEILNEDTEDDVTLSALESAFIFQLPVDENDKILRDWTKEENEKRRAKNKKIRGKRLDFKELDKWEEENEKKNKENSKSN